MAFHLHSLNLATTTYHLLSSGTLSQWLGQISIETPSMLTIAPVPETALPWPTLRGVGSRLLAPWLISGAEVISYVTWNARALYHHQPLRRKQKLDFLMKVVGQASNNSVIALQEVHGTPEQLTRMLFPLRKSFHILSSFTPLGDHDHDYKEDQGSVITLVPIAPHISVDDFGVDGIVPGCVLRVSFTSGSYKWYHWNIHNHGLT